MVCNLDLFFQHWYTLSKVVVFAHLAGELFNFGISHGLRGGHALFGTAGCCQSCNNRANNGASPVIRATMMASMLIPPQ